MKEQDQTAVSRNIMFRSEREGNWTNLKIFLHNLEITKKHALSLKAVMIKILSQKISKFSFFKRDWRKRDMLYVIEKKNYQVKQVSDNTNGKGGVMDGCQKIICF